mmetsp:Transcript_12662/g.19011  ORF Transcript_12662/g.19011 Transcript_12662/m.19011 type:complete len:1409 (+) Transcript_12662:151-4377(+)
MSDPAQRGLLDGNSSDEEDTPTLSRGGGMTSDEDNISLSLSTDSDDSDDEAFFNMENLLKKKQERDFSLIDELKDHAKKDSEPSEKYKDVLNDPTLSGQAIELGALDTQDVLVEVRDSSDEEEVAHVKQTRDIADLAFQQQQAFDHKTYLALEGLRDYERQARENAAINKVKKLKDKLDARSRRVERERKRLYQELSDSARHFFRKREDKLKTRLEQLNAYVKTTKTSLDDGTHKKHWTLEWEKEPHLIDVRICQLRAVKDKLPEGKYLMLVSIWDRLGGYPLQFQKHNSKVKKSTERIYHGGQYDDVSMIFNETVRLNGPSDALITPRQVYYFELLCLKRGTGATTIRVEKTVAWGVFPAIDNNLKLVQGCFKCPLIRGDIDMNIDKHSLFQSIPKKSPKYWLGNLYFEIKMAGVDRVIRNPEEYVLDVLHDEKPNSFASMKVKEMLEAKQLRKDVIKGTTNFNLFERFKVPKKTKKIDKEGSLGEFYDKNADKNIKYKKRRNQVYTMAKPRIWFGKPQFAVIRDQKDTQEAQEEALLETENFTSDVTFTEEAMSENGMDEMSESVATNTTMSVRPTDQTMQNPTEATETDMTDDEEEEEEVPVAAAPLPTAAAPQQEDNQSEAAGEDHSEAAGEDQSEAPGETDDDEEEEEAPQPAKPVLNPLEISMNEEDISKAVTDNPFILSRGTSVASKINSPVLPRTMSISSTAPFAKNDFKPPPLNNQNSETTFGSKSVSELDSDTASDYIASRSQSVLNLSTESASDYEDKDIDAESGSDVSSDVEENAQDVRGPSTMHDVTRVYNSLFSNIFEVSGATRMDTTFYKQSVKRKKHTWGGAPIYLEKLLYLQRSLAIDMGLHNYKRMEFYIMLLFCCFIFFIRAYPHYLGQYIYFSVIRKQIKYTEESSWYHMALDYDATITTPIVVYLYIIMGMAFNMLISFTLFALTGLVQFLFNKLPLVIYRTVFLFGCSVCLDPILISIIGALYQDWQTETFKLADYYEQTEKSTVPGILITVALYVPFIALQVFMLYQYTLRVHMNRRVLDVYKRLHTAEIQYYMPHDLEVHKNGFIKICNRAKKWRGADGHTRLIVVKEIPIDITETIMISRLQSLILSKNWPHDYLTTIMQQEETWYTNNGHNLFIPSELLNSQTRPAVFLKQNHLGYQFSINDFPALADALLFETCDEKPPAYRLKRVERLLVDYRIIGKQLVNRLRSGKLVTGHLMLNNIQEMDYNVFTTTDVEIAKFNAQELSFYQRVTEKLRKALKTFVKKVRTQWHAIRFYQREKTFEDLELDSVIDDDNDIQRKLNENQKAKHIIIYNVSLSRDKTLFRHFVLCPDGVICEVFDKIENMESTSNISSNRTHDYWIRRARLASARKERIRAQASQLQTDNSGTSNNASSFRLKHSFGSF